MEQKNLNKALDIVSKLITGEEMCETGSNAALYQEYNTNAEVYDIVQMTLKKMNLYVYEYRNKLFISPGENNSVFGYSNEELRKEIGVKVNKELYLCYFIIYNTITEFYTDSNSFSYAEFARIEDVIKNVDVSITGILDKSKGLIMDEIEENSFKQIALLWDGLPVTSMEDTTGMRAARNSKTGYVKLVFNYLVRQELFVEAQARYYPTDRFRALVENYFDEFRGRLAEIMSAKEEEHAAD